MAHFSENGQTLEIVHSLARNRDELFSVCKGLSDVCVIVLPASKDLSQLNQPLQGVGDLIAEASKNLGENVTLVVLGEVIDLVQVQSTIPDTFMYQH